MFIKIKKNCGIQMEHNGLEKGRLVPVTSNFLLNLNQVAEVSFYTIKERKTRLDLEGHEIELPLQTRVIHLQMSYLYATYKETINGSTGDKVILNSLFSAQHAFQPCKPKALANITGIKQPTQPETVIFNRITDHILPCQRPIKTKTGLIGTDTFTLQHIRFNTVQLLGALIPVVPLRNRIRINQKTVTGTAFGALPGNFNRVGFSCQTAGFKVDTDQATDSSR
jgi:hypothetical protein